MATQKGKRKRKHKNFYALKKGGKKGIYNSYQECERNFHPSWKKPLHKGFDTFIEAYNWLNDTPPPPSPPSKPEPKFTPLF